MLALKLTIFAVIISSGVLGRDTRRGNVRHRQTEEEYKYNHPPVPENYEAIPVAVVYDDQSNRENKSFKNEITPGNNVEEVSKETPNSEATLTPSDKEAVNDETININPTIKPENLKPTTYKPPNIHEIPVAVVYDPETINYQKPNHSDNRGKNNRRTTNRPALEDNDVVKETINLTTQVNGHTGSIQSEAIRDNTNRRRKISRPAPEKQTVALEKTLSTAPKVVNSPTVTPDKPEELYKSPNMQQSAAKEIKTTVETQTASIPTSGVQKNAYTGTITTSKEPDQLNKRQKLQNPATKDTTPEPHTPSTPSAEEPEDLNKRRNSQNLEPEQQQTAFEDNSSTREQVHGYSVPKPERSETVNNKKGTQQFAKRDNSTRIREVIPIIQSENVLFSHSGNFKYSYEGGDGTKAFEAGELKTFDDDTAGEAVSGGFSYTDKDGKAYSLSYTADENGYRPVGDHLPTPPPIPPAIQRALAYLATKTTPEPVTKSIAEYDQ